MIRLIALVLLLVASAWPAQAARLISGVSNDSVQITSSFAGERMTFYGTVAPAAGSTERVVEGPFNVVIVVLGPSQDRVARRKTNNFGIWLNTEQVEFRRFPSYFHVLSSRRLLEIADINLLNQSYILPEAHAMAPNPAGFMKTLTFGRELIRLMSEEGLFGVQENGVQFMSDTFYSAQLTLPSNAPVGPYIAQTYVFKDGQIIARKSEGFAVRKIGFERFLAQSATQSPFFYGLACVILALVTGWMGGIIFKR
ncbi:TIGR02186 family protein [Devosia sp. YIM 151766]|uniref:TIGR02186 family protein n=1 Tax=Devosia sp. YIM 151766 TaxID=3017325 RepID=UPI00255D0624|nr:TIGR02186 family protein [Devosia sp. YIM 151766]WIY53299.1 TIGR02186 family protein [Devosia sp. YIM 151766]